MDAHLLVDAARCWQLPNWWPEQLKFQPDGPDRRSNRNKFGIAHVSVPNITLSCLAIPLLIGFSESTGEHTICPMLLARRFWESHLQFWCGALSSPRSTIDNLKVPVRRRTGEGEIIDLAIA